MSHKYFIYAVSKKKKICKENKLSQSKATGILVEEALASRGILNSSINIKYLIDEKNKEDKSINRKENFINVSNINLRKKSLEDEIQMINDFIEYKFFKDVMKKNYRNDN